MKRYSLAVICGALLFVAALQVIKLQAQNPSNPTDDPEFRANAPSYRDPITQPVPGSPTPQLGISQNSPPEKTAEFSRYPIWLLIRPGGIQFLQSQEEIAVTQNAIPPSAFLLGCVSLKFEGAAAEKEPEFQLNCEDFILLGRYGTNQYSEAKGASLNYSTRTDQIRMQGTDELPLEMHSVDAASESRMRAEEITLQLQSQLASAIVMQPTTVRDQTTGQHRTDYVPVTKRFSTGSSFQLSARNITFLETIAIPSETIPTRMKGESPFLEPVEQTPASDSFPVYEDPSSGQQKPVPPRKTRSNNSPSAFDPFPDS